MVLYTKRMWLFTGRFLLFEEKGSSGAWPLSAIGGPGTGSVGDHIGLKVLSLAWRQWLPGAQRLQVRSRRTVPQVVEWI